MATVTYTSNKYDGRQLRLVIEQVQDIANNKSVLNWTLYSEGGAVNYYSIAPTTIKINGTQVYYKDYTGYTSHAFPAARGSVSGSITVSHNIDGSLAVPVTFTTRVYYGTANSYGGTFTLTDNPRAATLTAAPDFNDEQSPTISYSNPAGDYVTTIEASISSPDGSVMLANYRAISKSGTSYTFNLTAAERVNLRQFAATAPTAAVKFNLRTTIDSTYYYSAVSKTLTIINDTPTLSPVVETTDSLTLQLTGNNSTIIKDISTISYAINAVAYKEATITAQSVFNSGKYSNSPTGTLINIQDGYFLFGLRDSRGRNVEQTVNMPVINYIKPTCNADVSIALVSEQLADITVRIYGNLYNGSFGAFNNSLMLLYRYKQEDGSYNSWVNATATATPTLSGNTYELTVIIRNVDYRYAYTVQCEATDSIMSVRGTEHTVKAIPVFDWSETDFNFNVPIAIEGQPLADFIIDRYTNDFWTVEKWASGKAVCYGTKNFGSVAVNTAWGSLYSSAAMVQNLPSGLFTSVKFSKVELSNGGGSNAWCYRGNSSGINTTSAIGYFYLVRPTSATISQANFSFYVVGEWR